MNAYGAIVDNNIWNEALFTEEIKNLYGFNITRPIRFLWRYILQGCNSCNFLGKSRETSLGIVPWYSLDDWGSVADRSKIVLVSTESRQALSFTKSPIQWVPELFYQG
jgi:hypothetical protein